MTDFSTRPQSREDLIASMTENLAPVRRVKPIEGVLLIAAATAIATIGSIAIHEFWWGLLHGEASGYFLITHGLLLIVGLASAAGIIASAQPRVGSRGNAPAWSFAMLSIVPAAAIISLISAGGSGARSGFNDPAAWLCTQASLTAALVVAAASILWLRRGAPVSIERSAWLTGLAAGSLGTLAYGITCPVDSLSHVGLWHFAPVVIAAVIGRFAVPPLIRW
ncbi:DUF1109 domain-containing protein [Erythrobacter insulae]|uniref:DUF1109 domain-containing protein n=1 Tax=Erythrobacter insulae TaxID=2584124 RepID=A0A547PC82_9SPHN|nr:DUF1109 domain-containing protein [Erythrobacter insulae]TRD11753.1 DUF1109 domain-containing protein [Erythrobacter insulae]